MSLNAPACLTTVVALSVSTRSCPKSAKITVHLLALVLLICAIIPAFSIQGVESLSTLLLGRAQGEQVSIEGEAPIHHHDRDFYGGKWDSRSEHFDDCLQKLNDASDSFNM
ncbi:uncharacterized protein LOC131156177 [Malania oleifera]|uniref:uncharacterized protein LOC131156177 n=1 Tax=Malania oleifera TaxID=397392 RepID=UPI0025AE8C15|nr:uncharacterized protein LOC131156177 [Malania oleifera]